MGHSFEDFNMFVLCIALLILPALIEGCGNRPTFARVINGQNASPHAWPWQASLRVRGRHICGGTLIRPDWVLTAAHCVDRNPSPSGYTVVLGAHQRTGTTSVQQTFNLKQLIKHQGFTMQNLKHDVALLQLDRPASLSDKVNVACLPSGDAAVGARCYITGWGKTNGAGNSLPNILQQAALPVVSQAECKKKYPIVEQSPHLCAGEGRAGASGGCNGDSGGPFVCQEGGRWVVHGAVSFGQRNCPTTHYTVFARVNSYLSWISKYIGSNPPPPTNGPPSPPPPPPTNGPPPPPTNGPPPPGCKDTSALCTIYPKDYVCNHGAIKIHCKKTCNLC